MLDRKYQGIIINSRKDVRGMEFVASYYDSDNADSFDFDMKGVVACLWNWDPLDWNTITGIGRKMISEIKGKSD